MRRSFVASVIVVLAFALPLAGCRRGEEKSFTLPRPAEQPAGGAPAAALNSYADVVARVAPAVVTIRAVRLTRLPRQHPFLDEETLRDFFGRGGGPQQRQQQQQEEPRAVPQRALGSGVVISPDGYIVTNHHVVDGAEQITVEFTDRRSFAAKLVGTDAPSDLAVLKVEAKDLPTLTLGDSDRVRVGDVVLAVGNPLGVGQTVTAGIISAKGRRTGLSDGSFEDFLQTDAPINQGNSGGALVNTSGELVGINSQIFSPTGGNIGIGFAIPSNMTRGVTEQLISKGRVRRGQLGVFVQGVTDDIAQSLGMKETKGVLVNSVQKGSAGERAGLQRGDIVTALNGTPVNDANELRNLVAATQPGTEVTLDLLRDGREQQVKVTLGELSASADRAGGGGGGEGGAEGEQSEGGRLGITVAPLTPETAGRFQLPRDKEGIVVTGVDPAGPAGEAGIQQGDLVEQANRRPVRTVEDLRAAIEGAGDRPLLLLVTRGDNSIFVTVRPKK
ncbi:MAG TPA: DegQ family serine endoprotease [Pyrinomonadaceae bacterium]|jgi:Do/DeqQ family serine protease